MDAYAHLAWESLPGVLGVDRNFAAFSTHIQQMRRRFPVLALNPSQILDTIEKFPVFSGLILGFKLSLIHI